VAVEPVDGVDGFSTDFRVEVQAAGCDLASANTSYIASVVPYTSVGNSSVSQPISLSPWFASTLPRGVVDAGVAEFVLDGVVGERRAWFDSRLRAKRSSRS